MQPIVSKIANFEEKKLLSSCSKSLEIYSEITKSKLLKFKNLEKHLKSKKHAKNVNKNINKN